MSAPTVDGQPRGEVQAPREPASVSTGPREPEPARSRLERLKPILICPGCSGELDFEPARAVCRGCAAAYAIRNGKIYFTLAPTRSDELDKVKGRLKRWLGRYYYTVGIIVIAPVYPFRDSREVTRRVDPRTRIVVDVGCGNHKIDPDVIGLDFFDYDAVDVVCDAEKLPFRPASVDAFFSNSLLEHLPRAEQVVAGIRRSTKEGGLGIHLVPFLMPFHAAPEDYRRYTHKGLEALFEGFEVVEQWNVTGPVSLLLLHGIEFLSALLSLGSARLRAYVYLVLCGLLFPIKYLDFFFVRRATFMSLAPTICTVVRKSAETASPRTRSP